MTDSSIEAISPKAVAAALSRVRAQRPLVQCITNDVVQEITANVLLAAGMSPAMVPAPEEAAAFAQFAADALLCNVGTPSEENSRGMKLAAATMSEAGKPWTLDPVGAGGTAWRDDLISDLIDLRPTVIRGNGSEILACAGFAHQYKGVDSLDSSRSALDAAKALAQRSGGIVCVNGMATLVGGTGGALSALTAGFAAKAEDPLVATIACCQFVKRAAEIAGNASRGPGSFHDAYLDALYTLQPENFLEEAV